MRRSLAAWLLLGLGLAQEGHRVAITLDNPVNRETNALLILVTVFSILVFGAVAGALAYVVYRYRARAQEAGEPPQFHGNDRLEVVLTVVPLLIILILFGFAARGILSVNRAEPGALKVEVTGHQFWWDFNYPGLGFRTSNELVLPAGVPILLEITSQDVNHSFWIPGLAGKRDAIPGQKTLLPFKAEKTGVYYGFCAELCGPSHARMLFRAIVLPKEAFDRFAQAARAYAPPVADTHGQQVFQQNCAACHSVQARKPASAIAPDLAFLGNRVSLGAGIMPHTPERLKAWIKNPAAFKPGVKMPAFPQLSEGDLEALVHYLEGLRVEGLDPRGLPQF